MKNEEVLKAVSEAVRQGIAEGLKAGSSREVVVSDRAAEAREAAARSRRHNAALSAWTSGFRRNVEVYSSLIVGCHPVAWNGPDSKPTYVTGCGRHSLDRINSKGQKPVAHVDDATNGRWLRLSQPVCGTRSRWSRIEMAKLVMEIQRKVVVPHWSYTGDPMEAHRYPVHWSCRTRILQTGSPNPLWRSAEAVPLARFVIFSRFGDIPADQVTELLTTPTPATGEEEKQIYSLVPTLSDQLREAGLPVQVAPIDGGRLPWKDPEWLEKAADAMQRGHEIEPPAELVELADKLWPVTDDD